jgi:hypothetical protein
VPNAPSRENRGRNPLQGPTSSNEIPSCRKICQDAAYRPDRPLPTPHHSREDRNPYSPTLKPLAVRRLWIAAFAGMTRGAVGRQPAASRSPAAWPVAGMGRSRLAPNRTATSWPRWRCTRASAPHCTPSFPRRRESIFSDARASCGSEGMDPRLRGDDGRVAGRQQAAFIQGDRRPATNALATHAGGGLSPIPRHPREGGDPYAARPEQKVRSGPDSATVRPSDDVLLRQ